MAYSVSSDTRVPLWLFRLMMAKPVKPPVNGSREWGGVTVRQWPDDNAQNQGIMPEAQVPPVPLPDANAYNQPAEPYTVPYTMPYVDLQVDGAGAAPAFQSDYATPPQVVPTDSLQPQPQWQPQSVEQPYQQTQNVEQPYQQTPVVDNQMVNAGPQNAYTAFGQPAAMPGVTQPYGAFPQGMPGTVVRPVAKKKSTKKIVIMVVAAVLVAVVASGILFGLYANGIIGGPKLQDYRDAVAQIEKIAKSEDTVSLHVVEDIALGLNADDDIDTDKIKTEVKDYRKDVQDFSGLKALDDESVGAAYVTMSGKSSTYGKYLTKLDGSLPDFAGILASCTNKVQGDSPSLSLYQQYDQYFTDCSAKITSVGSFPTDSLDTYSKSIKTYVDQKQAIMKQMEALGDPTAFTMSSQLTQLNELVGQFNAVPKPSSDGTKLALDVISDMDGEEPAKELATLEDAVNAGIESKGGHSFKFKRDDDHDNGFDFGDKGNGGNGGGDDGLGGDNDIFS